MQAISRIALVAAVVVCSSTAASAGERVVDAGVGAIAGAVVAGPVGFVGGGVIGYVAGPGIACDLGVSRCYRHRRHGHRHRAEGRSPAHGDDAVRHEDHGNY